MVLSLAIGIVAALAVACSDQVDVGVEGVDARWIDVEGSDARRALLVTPAVDGERAPMGADPPLVVVLHGLGQDAEHMAGIGGWPNLAADRGAVVAFADGWKNSWNAGTCCGDAMTDGVDDVAYLDALIDTVAKRTRSDRGDVYMVGFSNGAMMTYRYLCEGSVRLRGAASIAGTDVDGCTPDRPTDVIQITGSDDEIVPLNSSTSAMASLGTLVPASRAIEQVATACACPAQRTEQSGPARSTRWDPCAEGVAVRLDVIAGLTHTYPSVDGYDGTSEILEFWGWADGGLPAGKLAGS